MPEALALLEEVTRETPDYAWAQMALGLLYFRQAQYGQAVAAYGRAVALQDDYGEAWYNLGEAHLKLNDLRCGRSGVCPRPSLRFDCGQVPSCLGTALYKRREYAAAIVELQRAVALDSLFARARFNLGNALLRSGQQEEGRRQLALYNELEKQEKLLIGLRTTLARTPDKAELYHKIGALYGQRGQLRRSASVLFTSLGPQSQFRALIPQLGQPVFAPPPSGRGHVPVPPSPARRLHVCARTSRARQCADDARIIRPSVGKL